MMNRLQIAVLLAFSWLGTISALSADRPDDLIDDFGADSYGSWQVTGAAFGTAPAAGTLPRQMPVTGFKGERLANSYHGGDRSTGTLTSPPVELNRKYLNFLIGGGRQPGKCELQLLIDDTVVATATGRDDEQLQWHTFQLGKPGPTANGS